MTSRGPHVRGSKCSTLWSIVGWYRRSTAWVPRQSGDLTLSGRHVEDHNRQRLRATSTSGLNTAQLDVQLRPGATLGGAGHVVAGCLAPISLPTHNLQLQRPDIVETFEVS